MKSKIILAAVIKEPPVLPTGEARPPSHVPTPKVPAPRQLLPQCLQQPRWHSALNKIPRIKPLKLLGGRATPARSWSPTFTSRASSRLTTSQTVTPTPMSRSPARIRPRYSKHSRNRIMQASKVSATKIKMIEPII